MKQSIIDHIPVRSAKKHISDDELKKINPIIALFYTNNIVPCLSKDITDVRRQAIAEEIDHHFSRRYNETINLCIEAINPPVSPPCSEAGGAFSTGVKPHAAAWSTKASVVSNTFTIFVVLAVVNKEGLYTPSPTKFAPIFIAGLTNEQKLLAAQKLIKQIHHRYSSSLGYEQSTERTYCKAILEIALKPMLCSLIRTTTQELPYAIEEIVGLNEVKTDNPFVQITFNCPPDSLYMGRHTSEETKKEYHDTQGFTLQRMRFSREEQLIAAEMAEICAQLVHSIPGDPVPQPLRVVDEKGVMITPLSSIQKPSSMRKWTEGASLKRALLSAINSADVVDRDSSLSGRGKYASLVKIPPNNHKTEIMLSRFFGPVLGESRTPPEGSLDVPASPTAGSGLFHVRRRDVGGGMVGLSMSSSPTPKASLR